MPPKKQPKFFEPENFYTKLDKKFKRTYHNPQYKVHGLEIPFRMIICGGSGSGKTLTLLNLIKVMNGTFNRIIVCTKNKAEPLYEMLEDRVPKHLIKFYEGYEAIPSPNDLKTELNLDGNEQILAVFDDLNTEKNQTKIMEYYKLGRKVHGGISSVYLAQSYFQCPKFIRINSDILILKKLASKKDLKMILSEYGLDITLELLVELYKFATSDLTSFFMIDTKTTNENLKYRKNFNGMDLKLLK